MYLTSNSITKQLSEKSASTTTLPYLLNYLLTYLRCVCQRHSVTYNINTCILLWSAVFLAVLWWSVAVR